MQVTFDMGRAFSRALVDLVRHPRSDVMWTSSLVAVLLENDPASPMHKLMLESVVRPVSPTQPTFRMLQPYRNHNHAAICQPSKSPNGHTPGI